MSQAVRQQIYANPERAVEICDRYIAECKKKGIEPDPYTVERAGIVAENWKQE